MKRALAERAKQSLPQTTPTPTAAVSSSPDHKSNGSNNHHLNHHRSKSHSDVNQQPTNDATAFDIRKRREPSSPTAAAHSKNGFRGVEKTPKSSTVGGGDHHDDDETHDSDDRHHNNILSKSIKRKRSLSVGEKSKTNDHNNGKHAQGEQETAAAAADNDEQAQQERPPFKIPRTESSIRQDDSSPSRAHPPPSKRRGSLSIPQQHDPPPVVSSTTSQQQQQQQQQQQRRAHSSSSTSSMLGTSVPSKTTSSSSRRGSLGGGEKGAAAALTTASMLQKQAAGAESDEASAFYLRHQNRALATELASLQFAVHNLEAERDARRQHCLLACQALHSLQATWTQLETALTTPTTTTSTTAGARLHHDNSCTAAAATTTTTTTTGQFIASTGTGDAVEWSTALQQALTRVGEQPTAPPSSSSSSSLSTPQLRGEEHGPDDNNNNNNPDATSQDKEPVKTPAEDPWLMDLSRISANVASRATVLQESIWGVLNQRRNEEEASSSSRMERADCEREMAVMKGRIQLLESQISELTASRDQTCARERKIRRSVYRLAAGMLKVEHVVQALECSTDGGGGDAAAFEHQDIATEVKLEIQQQQQKEQNSVAVSDGTNGNREAPAASASATDQAAVQEMKRRIEELQEAMTSREQHIAKLDEELKEKESRINELSLRQLSNEDVEKLESLESTKLQLANTEQTLEQVQSKLQETRQRWAAALGNEKTALATMEDQVGKFKKRWVEITNHGSSEDNNSKKDSQDEAGKDETGMSTGIWPGHMEEAKKRAVLQHKLEQALENVRQAESAREGLKDALAMNESLRAKLEEFKAKYAALQASARNHATRQHSAESNQANEAASSSSSSRNHAAAAAGGERESSATATPSSSSTTAPAENNHKSSSGSSSGGGGASDATKFEKLYRRARKDLAAATASKDAAKAKLERAEKERDSLMETNTKLLRQITEKDEMNANSLSTILHLKNMTEKLSVERATLEQQAKSASQLALAARLASNAKDRVSEEVIKEKKELEEKIEKLEALQASTRTELDRMTQEWSEASGKMTTLSSQLANAMKRSEELLTENQTRREELRKLVESSEKAERNARKAREKLNSVLQDASSSGGDVGSAVSAFSVKQLETQVNVLKTRLACPVCHYRDKECIIMRCRHMHCKTCVEERITNRSRKCPTCNGKFSEKDVEDVWLS